MIIENILLQWDSWADQAVTVIIFGTSEFCVLKLYWISIYFPICYNTNDRGQKHSIPQFCMWYDTNGRKSSTSYEQAKLNKMADSIS